VKAATLEILRCPFCGTRPVLVGGVLARTGDEITDGVLGCQCCAYPIVDGIPVLVADDRTRDAMHQLEGGDKQAALATLLQLDGPRIEAFRGFLGRTDRATYREAAEILSVDAEGQYFIYRLSDPTFRVAAAILRALGTHERLTRRTIDLCGGSGHLTRVLGTLAPGERTFLADVFFWKLWVARRFVAPACETVCCDVNNPLPFANDSFSMVVCSDAFPYIWQKRLMSNDMMRLAGPDGVVVMPHLHSALGENFTAGMTLTPDAYRELFEPMRPRLFRDSTLLDDLLSSGTIDLGRPVPAGELAGEPALAVIASRSDEVFRRYDAREPAAASGDEVIVNPLYRVEYRDGVSRLSLTFPTGEYAEEFAAVKRYLPEQVEVAGDLTASVVPPSIVAAYPELRQRLVLLDAPPKYC
jgi:uncharacterized protein YbaR (Trm112 family)